MITTHYDLLLLELPQLDSGMTADVLVINGLEPVVNNRIDKNICTIL